MWGGGREPGKCEDPLNILISATDRDHPVFRPDTRAVQDSQYDKWQAQGVKSDCLYCEAAGADKRTPPSPHSPLIKQGRVGGATRIQDGQKQQTGLRSDCVILATFDGSWLVPSLTRFHHSS